MRKIYNILKRLHQLFCRHQYDAIFSVPRAGWTMYMCRKCGHYCTSGNLIVPCSDGFVTIYEEGGISPHNGVD